MKYLYIFIFSIILTSCGGSGSTAGTTPAATGTTPTPTGNISSQVDPVQST